MRHVANACPPDEVLIAYGLGKSSDAGLGGIATHLDGCPTCVNRLASLAADSFVEKVLKGSTALPSKSLSGLERSLPGMPQPIPTNLLPAELSGLTQYSEIAELGRGGMGVVYLAKNHLLDRWEVLKVVGAQHLSRSGAKERFLQEVRAAARLHHPNVVAAYAVMEVGTSLVFAMEYVAGEDLAQVVRGNGPLGVSFACGYAAQVALGLQHAHEEGMVHRDIKPANLMLTRKGTKAVIKILDFGLAKVASETGTDTGLTGDGRMMGTPDFMAPEQGRNAARADIRADIYSLGCTLYYLLVGRVPFKGSTLTEVLLKHAQDEAVALNLVRPEVPVELASVVSRMMAKDPQKRYRTPAEVALALKPFMKSGPLAVKSSSPISQAGETARPTVTSSTATPPVAVAIPVVAAFAPEEVQETKAEPPVAVGAAWASVVLDADQEQEEISPFSLESTVREKKEAKRKSRKSQGRTVWIWTGVLAGVLLLGVLIVVASGIFVKTRDGTIELSGVPEDAGVFVDGEKVKVSWAQGKQTAEIRVRPGTRKVEVRQGDALVIGETVEIATGTRTVLTAKLKPNVNIEKPPLNTDPVPPQEQTDSVPPKVQVDTPSGDKILHRFQSGDVTQGYGPGNLQLTADGVVRNRVGKPLDGTWKMTDDGKTLVLRWPNAVAPGGTWIDTYTSQDGVTFRGTNNSTPQRHFVGRLHGSPTEQELADEVKIVKLQETLLANTWFYSDNLYPPGGPCQFYSNGTFHNPWKWRFWVVGPREMRVQYNNKSFDWVNGVVYTFNEDLTQFKGEFKDERGRLHRVTGTKQ